MNLDATLDVSTERRAIVLGRLALAGIVLYVLLDVVAQLLPPHYNPISQAESDLAVGPYGAIMTANFILRGLLSFALLLALMAGTAPSARSPLGYVLFGIWSAGAIVLAFFPTDVPPARATVHGSVHVVVALLAFAGAALGDLLISLRLASDPRWRSRRTAALTIAVLALIAGAAVVLGLGARHYFGLIERTFIALTLLWMVVIALGQPSQPAKH